MRLHLQDHRIRGRRAATLLAAAVALCLVAAPAATAAPRTFYGVHSIGTPSPSEWDRLGAGGLGSARIIMQWDIVQPTADAPYRWNHYDELIGNAARSGVESLPVIYGSPVWAAASPEHPPLANYPRFQDFVRAAAARYGHNGSFWTENPGVPKVPVTHWQIWNESNSESFWKPKPKAKAYVRMLRIARAGIKAGDPQARTVLAGFFPTPNVRDGVWLKRFLTQIYRAKGRKLFDVVAIHPYSRKPKHMLGPLREARTIMARHRDKKKPLWITEMGWASGGQQSALTVSPARQAAYLGQTFRLADRNRKRLKLQRVYWYSLRDSADPIWYANAGLFTVDGSPKPSWGTFASLAGGTP
jgi:polysaccharide biosynthesis protein PslG